MEYAKAHAALWRADARRSRYSWSEIRAATHAFASHRAVQWQFLLLALCGVLFWVMTAHIWPQTIDDAYITFRFSDNLIHGHGFRFNPDGLRVEGFTNFTWTVLIAGALALGLDAMFAAKVLGIACGLATMLGAWRLTAAWRGKEDALNVFSALLIAGNAHFAFWAVQGLETLLQPALIIAAYHFFVREVHDSRRWLVSPWLATLAQMTRPDSVLYFVPLGLWGAWEVLALRWPARRLVFCTLIGLMAFGAYTAWRVSYFGDWFPNTYYAKVDGEYINRERGVAHLYQFYFNQAGWVEKTPQPSFHIPPGPEDMAELERPTMRWNSIAWTNLWLAALLIGGLFGGARFCFLIVGPIALQAWYVFDIGGDWMPGFRFFQPIIPFLALSVPLAIEICAQKVERPLWGWWAPRWVFGLLAFFALHEQSRVETVYIFSRDPMWYERADQWWRVDKLDKQFDQGYACALQTVGEYLMLNTADDSKIFMSDIGLPAWFAPHLSIIDVDGLVDKYLADAPSVRDETFGGEPILPVSVLEAEFEGVNAYQRATNLRRERVMDRNVRYVMEQMRPEYILTFEQHPGGDLSEPGYIYPEPVSNVARHPAFDKYYVEVWHAIKTGNNVYNHLYRRKDVPPEIDPKVQLERTRVALERNPRITRLAIVLYEQMIAAGQRDDPALRAQVIETMENFPRNSGLATTLLFLAAGQKDIEMARAIYPIGQTATPQETALYRLMAHVLTETGHQDEVLDIVREGAEQTNDTGMKSWLELLERQDQESQMH